MRKTLPYLPSHEESDILLMKKWADVKEASWSEWSRLVGMENVFLEGDDKALAGGDLWWSERA